MLREFWNRLTGRRAKSAADHDARLRQMSPEERRLAEQWVEDTQADEFAEQQLGGVDPARLIDDGRPRAEDEPPRD